MTYPNESGVPDLLSGDAMILTFVVWSEISQQLLDGLAGILVQTFMFPSGCIEIVLVTFHVAPNTCKTNDISITLSCTLCLVTVSKY